MNAQSELANRFREVILSGTLIANTNFKNELSNLDFETTTAKFQNLNTISVLAQHIHYYVRGVKNVLLGGALEIRDKYSFDFPEISRQEEWDTFLETFWADSEEFAELVESMNEEKLASNFTDEKYGTYQRNIETMIEHSYYHLGQIVLIKKIVKKY